MNYTKTNNDLFRKFMDDIMFEFKHGAETDNVHPSEKAPPPATNAYNREDRRETSRSDDRRSEPALDERRDDRRDDRREETSRQPDRREPSRDERRDEPRRDDRRSSRDDDEGRRHEPRRDERRDERRDDSRGTPREEYSRTEPVIDTRERETRTRTQSAAPDSNYNPSITRDRVNDKPADSAGKYDDVPF